LKAIHRFGFFLLCRETERPKYLLLPVTHWGPFNFFLKCMEFGKKNLSSGNSDFDKETYPVFEHINDMYEVTVCDKTSPKASCLNRTCDDCGVSKLSFCTDELDNSKTARRVTLDTNVKKYRRSNHKWTIKINWKHRRRKINT
jgi:hypothetical protein